jgi:hypothetical protein
MLAVADAVAAMAWPRRVGRGIGQGRFGEEGREKRGRARNGA